MITIFYKSHDSIVSEVDEEILKQIDYEDLLWVDLMDATEHENERVEEFFGVNIQTRQQAEEIESSSRYSETDALIIANSSFLIPSTETYFSEPTSFQLKDGILISTRNRELRSFGDTQRKLSHNPKAYPTGYHIFVALFETRIDMDADMLENIARGITQLSKRINLAKPEDIDQKVILEINTLQENTMLIRENIIDKQRILSGVLKSERFPRDVFPKLQVMIKDTNSLINHADFSFDRLDYLQDTFLGLANIHLNKITKTFTVASVIFMPPTLIASIYGMNFAAMPELQWKIGYPFAIVVMILSSLTNIIIFKLKKLL